MTHNNPFTFRKLSSNEILIIFLTCERPDIYFNDLIFELKKYTLEADLYFDFMVNNGPNDRFYSACFKNGTLSMDTFKKVKNSDKCLEIANGYFANNWEVIEKHSVLTNFQKSFYKKKLSVKNIL